MRYNKNIVKIPDDWSETLKTLKTQTFKWRLDYCSRTENKTIGHIEHYSIDNANISNCVILIPGLGSNTRTEPLMKVIAYWALMNQHDVYCLDTFLGDFLPETSPELAEKHTFEEYTSLIDTGMDRIESECKAKKYTYSCVIGHSAGAVATLEIYNKRVRERKKLRFSASILFAPYVDESFITYITDFYFTHHNLKTPINNKEEFETATIGMINPHEPMIDGKIHRLSVQPKIYKDIGAVEFDPELMGKYGIPITLVAGGRDRKSPPNELRKKYKILRNGKNGNLWKFVVFKDSRHSFIDQYKDCSSILQVIQSQKRFAQQRTK